MTSRSFSFRIVKRKVTLLTGLPSSAKNLGSRSFIMRICMLSALRPNYEEGMACTASMKDGFCKREAILLLSYRDLSCLRCPRVLGRCLLTTISPSSMRNCCKVRTATFCPFNLGYHTFQGLCQSDLIGASAHPLGSLVLPPGPPLPDLVLL